ncbi:MAG: DRTGG domain-containing protein [Anaerolineaceae bacterium]|jgi:serine kinase of HPr protein (carbohydrate metabolism regulator)
MKIDEIVVLVEGKLLTHGANNNLEVAGAFAGDLMSDVLATIKPEAILLTGLNNPQVIRTALIADIRLVILARGKIPSEEMIELANNEGMPLISSPLGLFELSARLAKNNIVSFEQGFKLSRYE